MKKQIGGYAISFDEHKFHLRIAGNNLYIVSYVQYPNYFLDIIYEEMRELGYDTKVVEKIYMQTHETFWKG